MTQLSETDKCVMNEEAMCKEAVYKQIEMPPVDSEYPYLGVDIVSRVSKEAAIVDVTVTSYGANEVYRKTFTGVSKKHPVDKPDLQVAYLLALGRAFEKAGKVFARQGNGLVKHKEDSYNHRLALAVNKISVSEKAKPKKVRKTKLKP